MVADTGAKHIENWGMTMAYESILVEQKGAVTLFTINRPQALNALNSQVLEELIAAFAAFEADPVQRCAVLTGSGEKAFAAGADGRANATHRGDPRQDTADFSDGVVGNLRVDYALPSANLTLRDSGVFWPAPGAPSAELAGVSDHHLVWVDVTMETEE